MKTLGKILFWWGAAVIGVLYLLGAVHGILDAYAAGGLGGVLIGITVVMAIPALIAGVLMME